MKRIPFVPTALAFVVHAALAFFAATRLPHTGAPLLLLVGTVFVVAAVGIVLRQLWAYVFGLLFLGVSVLLYGAAAVVAIRQAFGGPAASGDWIGVRAVVVLAAAGIAAVGFALSATLFGILVLAWRTAAERHAPGVWLLSTAGAVAAVGAIGWIVGHDYLQRRLVAQNECFAGVGNRCAELARTPDRFTVAERVVFARSGCRANHDGSCRMLLELLSGSHAAEGESSAVAARCEAGSADICQRLGAYLLAAGDATNGSRYLQRACAVAPIWCSSAGKLALDRGQTDLSRELLQQGCEGKDARSCRDLLRQSPGLGPEDRQALELRTCLVGDVNDCRPLMRRDARSICARLCEGDTEEQLQSCFYCGKDAEEAGSVSQAVVWFAAGCDHGYRPCCREAIRLGPTR